MPQKIFGQKAVFLHLAGIGKILATNKMRSTPKVETPTNSPNLILLKDLQILAATQIACGIPIQKLTSKSSKTSPKLQFTLNSYKTQVLLQYFVRCTKQAAHGSGGVLTAEPLTKLFIN